MKPAPFSYYRTGSAPETAAMLAELGDEGAGEGGGSAAGAVLAGAVRDELGLAASVGRLPLTPPRVQELATNGGGR